LIERSNGMSGESLRAMIVLARWIVTVVASGGGSSPSGATSSICSRTSRRNRFAD